MEEKQKRIEFLEKKVQTKDEVLAELMAEHIALRGIVRWAHRGDERGREDSFLRRPTSIGSKDPMP